ncbi:cyclopropane fatty-acyl-phospholipid synthase-like methyltransferase [Catalinimonas alkaloidigena]|uniref:SAM-dependent methyltransferase n=1 Tax=Catalinimonas alkaloidigena TaxID=1075417 RepID=UPI002404DBE7|nr:class I SAM-dependent methyltransferase [Catalinimonas alkaloidigena]MDF9796863.1 cyclopropane fatty-acyl-phospholipid synthase-like methyltransferase [Catalinimonas alkaloidigena]
MKEMWNERYRSASFAYGKEPNDFFKEALNKYNLSGKVLFPAEGEGRNAVYAVKQGLDVTAFDISQEGKNKALKLAALENVTIDYRVGDFLTMDFAEHSFDASVLIFAHFPPNILSDYHKKIASLIKPEGLVILEGFSKNNLTLREKNPEIGGPNKLDMLFSKESIAHDFSDFEIIKLEEVEIELHEGSFHNGTAKVIRFIGRN